MTLTLLSCGGSEFSSSPIFEPAWPDAASSADAGDVYIRHDGGRGELGDVPSGLDDVADAGDAHPCDLAPCQCSNVHMALCCDGQCPKGFEGLSCYCGDCRFGQAYDAGRCF